MKYYLQNPLANNGIITDIPGVEMIDVTKIDYEEFFAGIDPDDEVVLVGGDGTINYMINHVDYENLDQKIYIYGTGTGNDFLNDINEQPGKEVLLNPYLKNLPTATVNGRKWKFINNMSFGIDGYCCEEADRIKAKSPNKKINYTGIAIKGLLYAYKPRHVWINVDGNEYEYEHAWLAPAMKGRYCGGGMMLAPGQDRNSDHMTVIVYHCKSKIKSLKTFPLIFEGRHVEKTDMVDVITGRKVHVRFDKPSAAQIDGETVLNVTEYTAEMP